MALACDLHAADLGRFTQKHDADLLDPQTGMYPKEFILSAGHFSLVLASLLLDMTPATMLDITTVSTCLGPKRIVKNTFERIVKNTFEVRKTCFPPEGWH